MVTRSSSAPVASWSTRSCLATVAADPANCVDVRSDTSARSSSLHEYATAVAGDANFIAPWPERMDRTHSPYGAASSRASASVGATTTSADTST